MPRPARMRLFGLGLCATLAGCAPFWEREEAALKLPDSAALAASPAVAPADSAPAVQRFSAGAQGVQILREEKIVAPENEQADISLSFDKAPLSEAAALVFGEILKKPYIVDAGADVPFSLRTAAPITASAVLPLFSAALRAQGLWLEEQDGIMRLRLAAGLTGQDKARSPDWSLASFPLQHLAPLEARKLLSLALPEERLVAMDAPPLLLASGSLSELTEIEKSLKALDQAPLAGMSAAIVPLRHLAPDAAVTHLRGIFGLPAEDTAGTHPALRLVPVPARGALVVLARSATLRDSALEWLARLDTAASGSAPAFYVYPLQHRKVEALLPQVQLLLGDDAETRLSADPARGALLVHARPATWEKLTELLRQLDTPAQQVLIEARILEVTLNDALRYGVQYAVDTGALLDITQSQFFLTGAQSVTPLSAALPGTAFALGGAGAPELIVEALAQKTEVRMVSAPRLMVLDHTPARLQVGDSVPITTQTSTDTQSAGAPIVNAVQYRDTGVTLEVTPHTSAGGPITLEVTQDVSDVTPTTSSAIDSPTIQQRKLTTEVAIPPGATMVLGGIIRERESATRSGIPVLSDLPLIGEFLFGRRENNSGRTELLALLTPYPVTTPPSGVTLTEQLRKEFDKLTARPLLARNE